ncbi:hypothetical protein [Cellulosimicrobium sp. CUA-896]|uniref:hypothetical protein n=1 Tax=Cellulosimicrobium sp. CUA-896 TaxID=1517881 RepID=UPI0009690A90|nr:hypothetical protein BJF88_11240 [Cellulosimicrobium sp. CUA-896]
MSSTVTVSPARGVRGIGLVSIIAGIVLVLAGVGTWIVVATELSSEEITVSDDASFLAGRHVAGPFTAYAQADVIDQHALEASGGQTYAQLDQDDPTRDTVMNASFLRASLYTSVVAFGVCALVVGLGILFILIGAALRRLAGGPSVAVETPAAYTSSGELSEGGRHVAPGGAPHGPSPAAPPVRPEPSPEPGPSPRPDRTSAYTTPGAQARAAGPTTTGPGPDSTSTASAGRPSDAPTSPGSSPEAAPPSTAGPDEPERRGEAPRP